MLATGVSKSAQDVHEVSRPCLNLTMFGAQSLEHKASTFLQHNPLRIHSPTFPRRRTSNTKVETMIGTGVSGLTANEMPGDFAEVPSAAQGVPSTSPSQKDRFIVLAEDPALASRSLRAQVRRTLAFCIQNPAGAHPPAFRAFRAPKAAFSHS